MTEENHAIGNARAWHAEIAEWAAKDYGDEDVREADRPEPLSLLVRSDWTAPGKPLTMASGEYGLLLSTGGPALRIIGRLDGYCEPANARMEWRDRGTPWTEFPCDREPLLAYARSFYYGEG